MTYCNTLKAQAQSKLFYDLLNRLRVKALRDGHILDVNMTLFG
jgi:hypothetical protein